MIAALEALVLLLVLLAGIFFYRRLIHSERFSRLVADVTHPSPESDDDVLHDLDHAEDTARQRARLAKQVAAEKRETAARIQRRLRRKS